MPAVILSDKERTSVWISGATLEDKLQGLGVGLKHIALFITHAEIRAFIVEEEASFLYTTCHLARMSR